ncbi:GlxA family transcriptional regulator [Brevundimonas sp.]|uniref:GlxA family transcriptional regulator n=1 Tax=Brevundimonas sp. TaxID=1871086 RepID=UPI002ABAF957|nr:helix-turn-helix domain-containing protein [Brevundimonas sp.]MDZ4365008.1 helix-turn-helix domain-containing protein [Brevundimonas sp.]
MPRIAIVISDGVLMNAVFEVADALSLANRYTAQQYAGRETLPPTLEVRLVSVGGEAVRAENGRVLAADEALRGSTFDLVHVAPFVVGRPEDLDERLKAMAGVVDWISECGAAGTRLAASGSGIAVLARAGLLNDIAVPVAWWLERPMRRLFPHLTLDPERAIAAQEKLLLAGRHVAEPALAIRIVEQLMSPDVATWIERITGVDAYPDGPDPAHVFTTLVLKPDELVARAAHWLQLRFAQKPQMADLSAVMAVHPRTLNRRFVASLGMTPVEYLQRLRIEAAKRMLARSDRRVDRVGYLVGYADPGFFKILFRKHTGLTPGEYRRQAREGAVSP